MSWPNQPLDCDAYSRFGSAGEPLRWYISQPAKCGPLTSHFSRLPSEVRMNAPFFVPTSTRTPVMFSTLLVAGFCKQLRFARSSGCRSCGVRLCRNMKQLDETAEQCLVAGEADAAAGDRFGGRDGAGHQVFDRGAGLDDQVRIGPRTLGDGDRGAVDARVDDDLAEVELE